MGVKETERETRQSGKPNKVQSVVMGSKDMSWGESESKTKRWKSWRGG